MIVFAVVFDIRVLFVRVHVIFIIHVYDVVIRIVWLV